MALRKCPKCELNYVKGDQQYCDVCLREMRRIARRSKEEPRTDEVIICSECGEAPAVPGSDLCAECLKEQKRQAELEEAAMLSVDFDDDAIADGADGREKDED